MTRIISIAAGCLGLALLGGRMEETASTAPAQGMPAVGSSTDVTAFEGARGGQAEGGLRALGYEPVRSEGLTTYWFNRDIGACARITTSDGRYSDVTMLTAEDR
jgi:hypothetical protein